MKKTMLVLAVLAMAAMIAAPASAAQFYETFDSYSDGLLAGQGGWLGNVNAPIYVEDGSAKLVYDDAYRGVMLSVGGLNISGDMIYFKADVYAGGTGDQGNSFDILVNDASGYNFARWYGAWNTERPRINGFGQVLGTVTLVSDQWNELMVTIDTVNKQSTFYLNGVSLGSLAYALNQPAIGNAVAEVKMGFQNATTYNNGSYKYYDNIYVGTTPDPIPEPSSLAAFGMFGLGALGYLKRRRA